MRFASLGSGSLGHATLVASGKTRILIDGGFSARELAARIRAVGEEAERIQELLVTAQELWREGGEVVSDDERIEAMRTAIQLVNLADLIAITTRA